MRGRPITILGKLDRDRLPDLEQISLKVDRDLRDYYVVRCGSWAPLDQSWKKPLVIPAAPKLTPEYLKSCGIDLTERSPEEILFEAESE